VDPVDEMTDCLLERGSRMWMDCAPEVGVRGPGVEVRLVVHATLDRSPGVTVLSTVVYT